MKKFYRNKTILITWTTWFKWSWLAFWLYKLWADVIWYSLIPDTKPNNFEALKLEEKITQIYWDINDLKKIDDIVKKYKPEIIFHLAAQPLVRESFKDPIYTFNTNVIWTVNILETIRLNECVKGAIMITTDKVYQNKETLTPYTENDRLWGYDPYSSSKAMCELAISSYNDSFLIKLWKKVVSVRAWNVIWWWDWSEDRLIPDIIRSIFDNEELSIRNPNSVRPWQYVLEALYWYLLMWEKIFKDDKYLWAYNFWPDISDNLKVINIVEESIKILWEWNFEINQNSSNHHEAWLLLLDNTKAKTLLWWSPQYNVTETLNKTLNWYKKYYNWDNIEEFALDEINQFKI